MSNASENITKLRELTDVLNSTSLNPSYEVVLRKLNNIINSGKNEIANSKTPSAKIRCYENMCMTITSILKEVQL